MNKILLFGLALCGAGVAMLITGLLPQDKMDKVRSRMGDPKEPTDRGQARLQLIVCGIFCLIIGGIMVRAMLR